MSRWKELLPLVVNVASQVKTKPGTGVKETAAATVFGLGYSIASQWHEAGFWSVDEAILFAFVAAVSTLIARLNAKRKE